MIGLRATMYAIVKKVTKPPRTSWATDEPRSEILKYESSISCAFLILLTGVFATPCAIGRTALGRYVDLTSYLEVTLETTPREMAIDCPISVANMSVPKPTVPPRSQPASNTVPSIPNLTLPIRTPDL